MRIVVNHLTRMRAPRICVAGIDADALEHVRPTTFATDPMTRKLLRAEGGPLRVGAAVDLGAARHDPAPPECEDHRVRTSRIRHLGDLSDDDFLALLDAMSCSRLEDGFGPDLERVGWKYAVEPGSGDRSLAVLRPRKRPRLEIESTFGHLQLRFDDPDPRTYMRVTDIRFYEPDQATIRKDLVDDVSRRLRSGVDVYLMLGLARAWKRPDDDRERHWLQLNGMCLADRPVGDEP